MQEKIQLTVIGALVVWLIKEFIVYHIRRYRLKAGLVADIKLHIEGARQQKEAVATLVDETLAIGSSIPFPISYTVGQYSFYNSVQKDLPVYLPEIELVKVIKFYQSIWELDISINGLAMTLGLWERDNKVLEQKDISHLQNRRARIDSLYQAMSTNELSEITDLPDDYSLVKGAQTVVSNT